MTLRKNIEILVVVGLLVLCALLALSDTFNVLAWYSHIFATELGNYQYNYLKPRWNVIGLEIKFRAEEQIRQIVQ